MPLATSRKLIYDALPDANLLVEGSQMPIEARPSIMDVFMTTEQSINAREEVYVEAVRAFHDQAVGMLREDNAAVVDRMIAWQEGVGRAGVKAADVEPLLNGYFYFDSQEIKDVYAQGILTNALRVQSEFLVANGALAGCRDLEALVSDRIVSQI